MAVMAKYTIEFKSHTHSDTFGSCASWFGWTVSHTMSYYREQPENAWKIYTNAVADMMRTNKLWLTSRQQRKITIYKKNLTKSFFVFSFPLLTLRAHFLRSQLAHTIHHMDVWLGSDQISSTQKSMANVVPTIEPICRQFYSKIIK